MITEADAARACPQQGFLFQYVLHAMKQTTSPLAYHIGVGLSILAATCPQPYGMRYAGTLRPNMYTLLVGRSGEDQKSSALGIGKEVLFEAAAALCGDFPGSAEGLIESLDRQNTQLITVSEFGKLLAAAQRGYFEPIKTLLTDAWDCLDADTQVLAEEGWRSMGEVQVGDLVWALNRETEKLELVPALDVGIRPVREGERMMEYIGRRANIRTTEGHDFYVKYRDPSAGGAPSRNFLKLKGRDLAVRSTSTGIPLAAESAHGFPGVALSDDELRFIAWFMTDGTLSGSRPGEKNRIEISQAKPEMITHIRSLLNRLGFTFQEKTRLPGKGAYVNARPQTRFTVPRGVRGGKKGWGSLSPFLFETIPSALMSMSVEQFRTFWSELLLGDGEQLDLPSGGILWIDRQSQADALQEMAVLRGFSTQYSTRITAGGHMMFRLSVRENRYLMSDLGDSRAVRPVLVDPNPGERVWCVTNQNGTLVTRREGHVSILGNCTPQQRAKANNKIIRVDNPRLSVMGGCSVPYLEKHTLAEDWTGGFMGRWFVIHAQRERVDPDPVGDDSMKPWLVDELKRRAYTPAAGDILGLTPAAKQYWADWFAEVSNRQLPGNIVGIRARAPTIARKIAMLLGWDYGGAIAGQSWYMDLDVLVPAIAITELHIRSLVDLAEVIAEHPDARARRSVLDAIRVSGGEATLGQILTIMKSKRRPVMESLDAIMEEGRVVRYDTALGAVYRLI